MKFHAKLLSLITAVAIILGSFATGGLAATFSDVSTGASYASAISLLSSLSLLKGYDGGTFKPDGDITRAEFAAVIVRALGQEMVAQASNGPTDFTDVASDFWGSGYINVASKLGIINGYGDGNFGPENNVTYEQAVKMVVCALGYEPMALSKVGDDPALVWPAGYLGAAADLSILGGVNGAMETPAKRWQVARLVFNSLETKLMERLENSEGVRYVIRDKTLMKDYLKVISASGTFISNPTVSTITDRKARAGEVIIQNNSDQEYYTLKDGGIDTTNLPGRAIKYYYTETYDSMTLVHVEDRTGDASVLTISADNIADVTGDLDSGFVISYWEDLNSSRTVTAKTTKNPTVLLNGFAKANATIRDLEVLSGSLELIDSSRSGTYDSVHITKYEIYMVSSASASTKTVTDLYRPDNDGRVLSVDEDSNTEDVSIKRPDGTKLSLSSLSKYNVLSVKQSVSPTGKKLEILVSNQIKTGTINSLLSEDEIEIDETSYRLSYYFKHYYLEKDPVNNKLKVGDTGKFYLDIDGKIAAFEKTVSAASNYGLLIQAYTSGGTSSALQLVIVPSSGSTGYRTFTGASQVRLDGNNKSTSEFISEIARISEDPRINSDNPSESSYTPMLIRYTLNSSGQVNAVSTIEGDDITVDNLGLVAPGSRKFNYTSSSGILKATTKVGDAYPQFRLNTSASGTQVFVVPTDRSARDKYVKVTASNYFVNSTDYVLEAYDLSGAEGSTPVAKAIVVYGEPQDVSVNSHSPIALLLSSPGTTTHETHPYTLNALVFEPAASTINVVEKKINVMETDMSAMTLEIGDVFRYTATGDLANETSLVKLLSASNVTKGYLDVGKKMDNKTIKIVTGKVNSFDSEDSFLEIITNDSAVEAFRINSSTQIYLYTRGKTTTTTTLKSSDVSALDGAWKASSMDESLADSIMLVTVDSSVKFVYLMQDRSAN